MSRRQRAVEAIHAGGIIAIVRTKEADNIQALMEALILGGVHALEITMTVPGAVELTRKLARALPEDVVFGAGTVLDVSTAEQVMDAGARFVVSPVFRPEIIAACQRRDVACLPGCLTPTEILTAWEAGADIVKVFPATALGPRYLEDLRGPLPDLKLMPTGGVTLENTGAWIAAGAVAVGVGTQLIDPRVLAAGDFAALTERARRFVQAVATARAG
jgi:2-dehydro-3-deoxyphosphogluconate aldolase/(4S)-4-hydroxy-2-oxoglutarate aldolase